MLKYVVSFDIRHMHNNCKINIVYRKQ